MTSSSGIRIVAAFEAAKGVLVLLVGFGLLALVHHDAQAMAEQLVERFHLNPASRYPRNNVFPGSLEDVGFASLARGDYRVTDRSRYRRATGGKEPGADFQPLDAALAASAASSVR